MEREAISGIFLPLQKPFMHYRKLFWNSPIAIPRTIRQLQRI